MRDDPAARVIVVRSKGVPFKHLHHDIQEVFHRIERMEKPVIAALHRTCLEMALELALATHPA